MPVGSGDLLGGRRVTDIIPMAKTKQQTKWRALKSGELRQLGDWIKSPSLGWRPVLNADIGLQNTNGCFVLPVRRRTNPPNVES